MGNIYLIGFMGAGKSTVGRDLAARLGRPFCDTDELIEKRAGLTIPEIFDALGEDGFRRLEAEVIKEVAEEEGLVVALGGGAPLQDGNWHRLKESGITVYLKEEPEALHARLAKNEGRPLLAGYAGEERLRRIRELLAFREPRYMEADLVVDCRGRPPEELVAEILARLEECTRLK